jgi:hypothetical protein
MSAADGARAASILNVIAGIWLIISPFILAFSGLQGPLWNNICVGVVVLILAWIRAANPAQNMVLSWINALLGLWMIISPFALVLSAARPQALTGNSVVLGIVILVLGIWSALGTPTTWGLARR